MCAEGREGKCRRSGEEPVGVQVEGTEVGDDCVDEFIVFFTILALGAVMVFCVFF